MKWILNCMVKCSIGNYNNIYITYFYILIYLYITNYMLNLMIKK